MKLLPALFLLWVGEGEGTVGHRDIVADIGQFDRRAMALRVDRGPAIHLEPTRSGRVPEEGKSQLSVRALLRTGDEDTAVGIRHDLGPAVEVGRAGQQRSERRLVE